MVWDADAIALLEALYAKGLTGRQIGLELGCSRNAVIGKIDRMGWRVKEFEKKKRKFQADKAAGLHPKRPPRALPHSNAGRSRIDDRYVPYLPPEPAKPNEMKCCTLLQLTNKSCRWPIGDPQERDFHFCGNDVAGDGCVYCAYHTRISYTSAADRRADKAATQGAPYYGPQT